MESGSLSQHSAHGEQGAAWVALGDRNIKNMMFPDVMLYI
jgi:hypothetical protein